MQPQFFSHTVQLKRPSDKHGEKENDAVEY